jgi:hypothetical protein
MPRSMSPQSRAGIAWKMRAANELGNWPRETAIVASRPQARSRGGDRPARLGRRQELGGASFFDLLRRHDLPRRIDGCSKPGPHA